jgi:hypothetical protein
MVLYWPRGSVTVLSVKLISELFAYGEASEFLSQELLSNILVIGEMSLAKINTGTCYSIFLSLNSCIVLL